MTSIGISDLSLFIPPGKIELSSLVDYRALQHPEMERKLQRAVTKTGQKAIRFPSPWEDTATLAAEAARGLFSRNNPPDPQSVRYLVVGTETGLDHSKPLSAYVQGMLKQSGVRLTENLSTYQIQHACAGQALAMLSVMGLLQAGGSAADSGLVIGSDISRYSLATTAEITQGAGATALLVERNPRLVGFDLSRVGYASHDVDDFFRPLNSETARVKGYYSVQCYHEALSSAFADHSQRSGRTPAEALQETDLFVLHTPFRNMPEAGLLMLLNRYLDLDKDAGRDFLAARGFYEGIDPVAEIGNIYTGSLFLTMAFMLWGMVRRFGPKGVEGKRILLGSYGSGNTMAMIPGVVSAGAARIIAGWDLDRLLTMAGEGDLAGYLAWVGRSHTDPVPEFNGSVPKDHFYLAGIREDGYREYGYKG